MRELLEMTAIARGRVQGVGFRATTKRIADQLGLYGFVRNLPGGSVEICAQGEKLQLETLVQKLRGEFAAYLQEIAVDFHPVKEAHSHFQINH